MDKLNTKTQRIYDQVFQHPISHSLEWRDIKHLLGALGQVEQEHNGNLKVTVSGRTVTFQGHAESDNVTADQVGQLRHLIGEEKPETSPEDGKHLLLLINHQEAFIFHTELKNSVPERIMPFDPDGHKKHVHSAHDYAGPAEHPNNDAYYEAIAESLKDAEQLLIFGSGSGSSNAMDLFVTWVHEARPKLAERIIGAVTVNESHMSEAEILAKARDIYFQMQTV